jgi:transposase
MFWGCISGRYGKGTGLFWEKEWGTITTESYCEHAVPAIYTYFFHHPRLSFQQDGGSGHNTGPTLALLKSWNIIPIFWPPYSPDLSPIENLWERLKDILQKIDPEVHCNYRRLRSTVLRA